MPSLERQGESSEGTTEVRNGLVVQVCQIRMWKCAPVEFETPALNIRGLRPPDKR